LIGEGEESTPGEKKRRVGKGGSMRNEENRSKLARQAHAKGRKGQPKGGKS